MDKDELQKAMELCIATYREKVERQFAERLINKIQELIVNANQVQEYTAHPELAGYNTAMQEVITLLCPSEVTFDEARLNAAVSMGFIKKRGVNPYME